MDVKPVIHRESVGSYREVYQCDKCNKLCANEVTLKQHMLAHDGIKKFHCQYCDKSFHKSQVSVSLEFIST